MADAEKKAEADELEQAVDTALKAAIGVDDHDGPEWRAVRKSVEALKADRRRLLSESPAVLLERLRTVMGREAENAATVIDDELTRIAQATEGFFGDVRKSLDRFRKKP